MSVIDEIEAAAECARVSRCVVCMERPRRLCFVICDQCIASHTKLHRRLGDVEWAAKRARKYERKRAKKRQPVVVNMADEYVHVGQSGGKGMSEPRTSYETSVKLKEAGAPQSNGPYWTSRASAKKGKMTYPAPRLMPGHSSPTTAAFHSRAFTAGELIEMLGERWWDITRDGSGQFHIAAANAGHHTATRWGTELVEALAAVCLEVRPWEK